MEEGNSRPRRLGPRGIIASPQSEDRMSLFLRRRLTLDAVARVARMDLAEPQARRVSHAGL